MNHTETNNHRMKKAIGIGAIALLSVILIAAIILSCLYLFLPKSNPQYVAHQGYRSQYVGNTLEAFRAAGEMDFYGIETDVRKTADGVFVCCHDETVKFADGDEKTVCASTYAELSAKPLKNDKSDTDIRICTFEKYLQICKESGKVAIIELKETFSLLDVRRILLLLEGYDRASFSIISFYFSSLLTFKEEDATISLQYLSETKNDARFDRCLEEGISISVRQSILTKKLVTSFHEAGLTVNTWTINKRFDRNIVRIKGVDYVTTDIFDRS